MHAYRFVDAAGEIRRSMAAGEQFFDYQTDYPINHDMIDRVINEESHDGERYRGCGGRF
jgi:hypothetical protein